MAPLRPTILSLSLLTTVVSAAELTTSGDALDHLPPRITRLTWFTQQSISTPLIS